MKTIPFEEASTLCNKYAQDQCIILSWEKQTGMTCVTTFGVGDENSIQAANGGKMVKDFLKLKRENDVIPTRFEEWKIDSVERYYYLSGRNSKCYEEITFWYEIHTLSRKETKRSISIYDGQEYQLPDWAKVITVRNRKLESNY